MDSVKSVSQESLWEFEVYGGVFTENAPVVRDVHRNLPQDTRLSFTSTDFSAAFGDPDPGDSLQKIKITALPAHGVLRLGGTCSYTANNLNQYTAAGTVNYEYDLSGNMTSDEQFTYAYDAENRLLEVRRASQGPEPLSNACDTTLVFSTGGAAEWFAEAGGYYDNDSARSGAIAQNEQSWMQTTVEGSGTISFWWAIAGGTGDTLEFYIDDVLQTNGSIGGNSGWLERWYPLGSSSHTFKWIYKRAGSSTGGCGWVDYVRWQADRPPDSLADALDSPLAFTTGGVANWSSYFGEFHESAPGQFPPSNMSSAASGVLQSVGQQSWLQTEVPGAGTLGFWSKIYPEDTANYLAFSIDGGDPEYYSTSEEWEYHAVTLSSASHTLRWTYTRNDLYVPGRAFVDYVQWAGPLPPAPPEPTNWQTLTYVYDAAGRRIEKQYDGVTVLKYVYDGDHCIAEYDGNNNLRRKYIYGPGVDEPICMGEATGAYAGTYYYHFDALGSVVALTNSSGNTVQVYEYDVYGQVGSSDPNHPNRFLFTGREFDKETGLYYYRARYYNPQIGRFLQTDPVGYGAGMNLYAYCGNGAVNWGDPSGLDPCDPCKPAAGSPGWTYYDKEVYTINDVWAWLIYYGCPVSRLDLSVILGWDTSWVEDVVPTKRTIKIGTGRIQGVTVFSLNGIGLLDDGTLNAILKAGCEELYSFDEVNTQWDRPPEYVSAFWSVLDGPKLQDQFNKIFTPFFDTKSVGCEKWLYYDIGSMKSTIYDDSEINFIGTGHAFAHLYIPKTVAYELALAHEFMEGLMHRQVRWKLTPGVWYWIKKGYDEYGMRADWGKEKAE